MPKVTSTEIKKALADRGVLELLRTKAQLRLYRLFSRTDIGAILQKWRSCANCLSEPEKRMGSRLWKRVLSLSYWADWPGLKRWKLRRVKHEGESSK